MPNEKPVFKEMPDPGVPGAICVVLGIKLDVENDPRCQGGVYWCCLLRHGTTKCCKWAVPSPGEQQVNSIFDDPITFADVIGTDTVFTMGKVNDTMVSYSGGDTIVQIVDMRIDSIWIWE